MKLDVLLRETATVVSEVRGEIAYAEAKKKIRGRELAAMSVRLKKAAAVIDAWLDSEIKG